MQRLFCLILLLMLGNLSFADHCPSTKEIKKGHFHGFKLYDTDDGQQLSSKRLTQFRKNIDQFTLAEWQDTKDHLGSIHCYYRDQHGSAMEAYLMKNKLQPLNQKHRWYQVSGSMHCAANSNGCQFRNSVRPTKQLAKKSTKGLRDVLTRH